MNTFVSFSKRKLLRIRTTKVIKHILWNLLYDLCKFGEQIRHLTYYISCVPTEVQTSNYKTAKWLSEYSSSARKLYFSHRCLNIFKGNTAIPHSIDIERGNASKIHRTAASFIFNKLFKIFYNTHALNVVSWQSQELDLI